ncbi:PREDICTED: mediator of RNA polymerase II transcription subunit 15a-like [Populus euphratica]|uniref:Mediator of RNA polymerase II transcription subunit 15a-like n=1 Tax=Populus euphratica TaxID=75702 RepID=A0AAJ6USL1_POPEU|nr:PREDICTED: mediator of RNA polymerase II transcription subunit 15a-like [Populus euphratica]
MLNLANLPSTRPPDRGLTQVPKSNVSLNTNLKDSRGDLQKSSENLKGEMEHSGNSGNCEQEQGILHSPQVIAQHNPEEFLKFRQGSGLELQSSTLSMVKRDPQTTPAHLQQTQQATFTLHNPPSMVELPLLLSQQQEQPKGQKEVATDVSQKLLIAQESRVPDPQHHQLKLPCPYNDCQSLQSCSPTPEQKLLSPSQPPKLQQILNLSRQDEQQDDIKSEQHLCESNSERENVVNPVHQVSMRSLQLPLSTLPQPNDIKFLLKNNRNERAKANSGRSSFIAQRMDAKQKSLHHVSAQKKNQESQQSQMCQQLIKGNQEVPHQMQQDDEMPHQLNEVNDVKMTQGIKHETELNQRPEVKNLKFRQVTAVKSGVPPSIFSHRHIQAEPVQLPRHFPLTTQHNMLRSHTIAGSPSHSVNSQSGFSAKFPSNDSSNLNTDGFGFDASTINFEESCDAEKPILRLIKAVNSISSKALSASVSEIGSVLNLADSMAGSVPVYGSKGSVSEDLGEINNL